MTKMYYFLVLCHILLICGVELYCYYFLNYHISSSR